MPMLKLKTIIDKMEEIEDSTEFDGWDAWIELKDWFVKQKPPEADGLANWDDAEQSVHTDAEACDAKQYHGDFAYSGHNFCCWCGVRLRAGNANRWAAYL